MMAYSSNTILDNTKSAINILGLPVNPLEMNEVVRLADTHIKHHEQLLLGVVNAAKIVNAQKDPNLRQSLLETNLILADGLPVVWLSKLMGTPLPERVAGIDIMYKLLECSCENNYSVYFLGAKAEVVKKVVEFVRRNYPGVRIAGFRDGYFNENDGKKVAEEIKGSNADILFVAMSSPHKENFLRKWFKFMNVPVCHGGGGSFDVVAGVTKRAPLWMQKCGLEWLYRVIQEPLRMGKRYLVTNTIFIKMSLKVIIQARFNTNE